jgi:hypothetical protein
MIDVRTKREMCQRRVVMLPPRQRNKGIKGETHSPSTFLHGTLNACGPGLSRRAGENSGERGRVVVGGSEGVLPRPIGGFPSVDWPIELRR